jgi:hypothetical protein
MGKSVKVPNPVYQRIEQQAEREDVPRGVVVREWMRKAEKYDEVEARR